MTSASFRAGVVAVVSNGRGQVLAFERSDVAGAWQLPQGGIDVGETPLAAAWLELGEETGLGSGDVELVGEYPSWTTYEFPAHVRVRGARLGQAQRWFFFRALDDGVVPQPDEVEFVAWQWVERQWLVENVVGFRQDSYRAALLS